jgi:hypothetical protein
MTLNNGETVAIGDVILYRNAMAYLRDFSYYRAQIEFEDGTTQWIDRDDVKGI